MVSSYNFRFQLILFVSCVSFIIFFVKIKCCVSLCLYVCMCELSGKAVSKMTMTYTVSGLTINPTYLLTLSVCQSVC